MDFLKFLFGKNPVVIVAAMAGGIGIVNVLDSVIMARLSIEWTLIPENFRPLFTVIRESWQWLIDPLLSCLPFTVSEPWKNYMLMGTIVAGMRIRSSMVIWKALKEQTIESYTQKTIIPGQPLILQQGDHLKYYSLFLPIRLVFAFVAWPLKIFGATWRYSQGEWSKGFSEGAARDARQEQYLTFFGSVFWAAFIILICLLVRA